MYSLIINVHTYLVTIFKLFVKKTMKCKCISQVNNKISKSSCHLDEKYRLKGSK